MGKHDVVTEEEMADYKLSRELLRRIEAFQAEKNLSKDKMNILDWGCGRGRSVACLRTKGYKCFGVDIDPQTIQKGKKLFVDRGLDPDDTMRLSNSENKTNFTDGFFHFIFSQQVLEHVRDLESLATEAFRVTAPGGIGFHVYPAHKRVGEGHLYMPFVHWLPKNRLRELTIRFFLMLGKNPGWKEMRGKSIAEQAGAYYEYSLNHTFYRHWRDVANTFEKTGFTAKFITLGHIRIENSRVLSRLLKIRPVRAAAYRLHLYFFPFLELLVRKE